MLQSVVRAGAQALLQAAWEVEVDELLGRPRYARSDEFRGYRNGHLPERTIGVGMGALAARVLGMQSAFPKSVNPGTVIGIERPADPTGTATLLFFAVPGQPLLDVLS